MPVVQIIKIKIFSQQPKSWDMGTPPPAFMLQVQHLYFQYIPRLGAPDKHAAHQCVYQARPTMRTHDNQVNLVCPGKLDDRIADEDHRVEEGRLLHLGLGIDHLAEALDDVPVTPVIIESISRL